MVSDAAATSSARAALLLSRTVLTPQQDFDGEAGSALAGRDYFKKRFGRLAQKAGRAKEREIYIQCVCLLRWVASLLTCRPA